MCNKGDGSICHARAKNGSNSNRLREIGAKSKFPAFFVAHKPELNPGELRKTIGLAAGDSCQGCDRSLIGPRPGRIDDLARGRGTCRIQASGRVQRLLRAAVSAYGANSKE
jgi:hypothetical protein